MEIVSWLSFFNIVLLIGMPRQKAWVVSPSPFTWRDYVEHDGEIRETEGDTDVRSAGKVTGTPLPSSLHYASAWLSGGSIVGRAMGECVSECESGNRETPWGARGADEGGASTPPLPGVCERCARVPIPPSGSGRLLVHVPVSHMRARVTGSLDASGARWSVDSDDRVGGRMYGVAVPDLTVFAREFLPRLSGQELVEVRAVFIPEGTDARPVDNRRGYRRRECCGMVSCAWCAVPAGLSLRAAGGKIREVRSALPRVPP